MAITLVINNSRDLNIAIVKGFVFCGLTLVLMLSALGCAIFLALKKDGLEYNGDKGSIVGPFLLITAPFILHSIQLLTTLLMLHMARKHPEKITLTKCRLWSTISRILTAPILIEMMILIGFKWYLTLIGIPLVVLYFVTILQVEKIMHYFFTRNLSLRIPNRIHSDINHQSELLFFEYPYDIDVNSSFYRLSASNSSPRSRPGQSNNSDSLALALARNSPPPSYREALRIPAILSLTATTAASGSVIELPPPAYESLNSQKDHESLEQVHQSCRSGKDDDTDTITVELEKS